MAWRNSYLFVCLRLFRKDLNPLLARGHPGLLVYTSGKGVSSSKHNWKSLERRCPERTPPPPHFKQHLLQTCHAELLFYYLTLEDKKKCGLTLLEGTAFKWGEGGRLPRTLPGWGPDASPGAEQPSWCWTLPATCRCGLPSHFMTEQMHVHPGKEK